MDLEYIKRGKQEIIIMNEIHNLELIEPRYERKFRVDQIAMADIENMVRLHSAGFVEAYPLRKVNNIYFDTINMQTYSDNIDGIANSTKFRIRWYGELFGEIENPVLELKIKRNLAGTKLYYSLKPFTLEPNITLQDIHKAITDADMPEERKQQMLMLRPVLLNCYTRKYFISADRQYRLTLDYDLSYYRIQEMNNSFIHRNINRRSTIIELKYPLRLDECAHKISREFPFRMTKNSKYVTGVQWLYGR